MYYLSEMPCRVYPQELKEVINDGHGLSVIQNKGYGVTKKMIMGISR